MDERSLDDILKAAFGAQRVKVPPGQSPARRAGSESCVGTGWPGRRSVDSKRVGRVIEPRKMSFCGGRRSSNDGRQHHGCPFWRGLPWPAGVGEQGMHAYGLPRNLGDLSVSSAKSGSRFAQPRRTRLRSRPACVVSGERRQSTWARYLSPRKHRRRQGWAERSQSALIVPVMRGNGSHRTPRREAGRRVMDRRRERRRRCQTPRQSQRDSDG